MDVLHETENITFQDCLKKHQSKFDSVLIRIENFLRFLDSELTPSGYDWILFFAPKIIEKNFLKKTEAAKILASMPQLSQKLSIFLAVKPLLNED